ncbi:MAG: zinc-binding dehydrogenase, partial [Thermoplasmata archaeon]|nr:zinc-binding dehydrogenase [Thermoplasmata archaeon]
VARELGAVATVNAAETTELGRAVRAIVKEGADVALEAVGSPKTLLSALSAIRRGGRLCLVGYSAESAMLPLNRIMFHEYSLIGSLGCPTEEYPRVIELVRHGRVRLSPVITERMPLDRIGEGLDRLRRGEGLRTVIQP